MAWQVEWLILWKMIMKMLTHIHTVVYTWWCWHIYKKMKLDLMWINLVMEQRRERFETPPAECPPVECGQSDGAIGALDRKDRGPCQRPDAGGYVRCCCRAEQQTDT